MLLQAHCSRTDRDEYNSRWKLDEKQLLWRLVFPAVPRHPKPIPFSTFLTTYTLRANWLFSFTVTTIFFLKQHISLFSEHRTHTFSVYFQSLMKTCCLRDLLKTSFQLKMGEIQGIKSSLSLSLKSANRKDKSDIGFHSVFKQKHQTQVGLHSKNGTEQRKGMGTWRPSQQQQVKERSLSQDNPEYQW